MVLARTFIKIRFLLSFIIKKLIHLKVGSVAIKDSKNIKFFLELIIIPLLTGLVASLIIIFWQNHTHRKNILFSLKREIEIGVSEMVRLRGMGKTALYLYEEQLPTRQYDLLPPDDLTYISKIDYSNDLKDYYNQVYVLKKNYQFMQELGMVNLLPSNELIIEADKQRQRAIMSSFNALGIIEREL